MSIYLVISIILNMAINNSKNCSSLILFWTCAASLTNIFQQVWVPWWWNMQNDAFPSSISAASVAEWLMPDTCQTATMPGSYVIFKKKKPTRRLNQWTPSFIWLVSFLEQFVVIKPFVKVYGSTKQNNFSSKYRHQLLTRTTSFCNKTYARNLKANHVWKKCR